MESQGRQEDQKKYDMPPNLEDFNFLINDPFWATRGGFAFG